MATVLESNKTKIAKRVIEVFEFFNANNRKATVMDIVRRYERPQSSTSELLSSLVEMGLLYKDPHSRAYWPTPRLASLGSAAQPDMLRDGRLYGFMDQLAQSTRFGVGLFGMVGTHAQIFRWSAGADMAQTPLESGTSELLSSTTAGLLLLSTLGPDRARKMLWRINAEAAEADRFDYAEATQAVEAFAHQKSVTGPSGLLPGTRMTAVMLPHRLDDRPLVMGVVYPEESSVDVDALVATMRHCVTQCRSEQPISDFSLPPTLMRAV